MRRAMKIRKVGEILEVVVRDVTEKREKWKAEGEPENNEVWEHLGQWICGEIDIKPGDRK